jgi:hypothetical protein
LFGRRIFFEKPATAAFVRAGFFAIVLKAAHRPGGNRPGGNDKKTFIRFGARRE